MYSVPSNKRYTEDIPIYIYKWPINTIFMCMYSVLSGERDEVMSPGTSPKVIMLYILGIKCNKKDKYV